MDGARETIRGALAFSFAAHAGTTGELLAIAGTNARVVAVLAVMAWARGRAPALAPGCDAFAWLIVAGNAVLVGVAVGAHGAAALPWLVHLPLEWTALAVVAALHRVGRRGSVPTSAAIRATLVAVGLVLLAAAAETYLTPQS